MDLNDITLGSDPEFFVHGPNGAVRTAYRVIGDKDIPLPYGKAYPDGAAVEMEVQWSNTADGITDHVYANIEALREVIRAVNPDYTLSVRSAADVSRVDLKESNERWGRGNIKVLGCDPDYRAYPWFPSTQEGRPDPETHTLRTLGGHMHFGVGKDLLEDMAFVNIAIAMLDATVGTASVCLTQDLYSIKRKNMNYGLSGLFRRSIDKETGEVVAPYTLEYRTPSAKAIISTPDVTRKMFLLGQSTVLFAIQSYTTHGFDHCVALLGEEPGLRQLASAIDEHDHYLCQQYQERAADLWSAEELYHLQRGLLVAIPGDMI